MWLSIGVFAVAACPVTGFACTHALVMGCNAAYARGKYAALSVRFWACVAIATMGVGPVEFPLLRTKSECYFSLLLDCEHFISVWAI